VRPVECGARCGKVGDKETGICVCRDPEGSVPTGIRIYATQNDKETAGDLAQEDAKNGGISFDDEGERGCGDGAVDWWVTWKDPVCLGDRSLWKGGHTTRTFWGVR